MSFDEISEFRKCLSDLSKNNPGLINAGQRNLLWVIISYPDGCFIGFEELALQVGLSTDTINGYLRALTKLGFIDREQSYARKGVRQCYRVRVNVMRSRSLLPVTPKELGSVLPELLPPVTCDVVPVTSGVIASDQSHTYKYNKYNRNDKELNTRLVINVERWNVVSANLDQHVKRKFQPNKESEHLLDVILELPGITATGLRDRLGAINFATSTNNTGLLMNYLRELSGAKEANRSHHRTAWCGRCEKVSRTYAEQGPGNDGKLTNDCPTCNDNQVRVREREVINDPELLKEFGWDTFGSIPD
jgi:hypothetical protein